MCDLNPVSGSWWYVIRVFLNVCDCLQLCLLVSFLEFNSIRTICICKGPTVPLDKDVGPECHNFICI